MTAERTPRSAAIRFIVYLGFVSLFADMTYEGAYSITGPFLKGLGASAVPVGFIVACWGLGPGMQDASLRAGIAQVVSMHKRGSAFGLFNGAYGVMWFAGSVMMGLLYGHSLALLVGFGLILQVAAAGWFFWLRRPLAAEIAAAS